MRSRPKILRGARSWLVAVVAVSVVAAVTVACVPPPEPDPDPDNIANLTDEEAEERLVEALPDIEAAVDDPDVLAEVPEEHRAGLVDLVAKLGTADGRAEIVETLRDEAATIRGGFKGRPDMFAGGILGTFGQFLDHSLEVDDRIEGVRDAAPATSGASVPFESVPGDCAAPGGPGNVPAPEGLVPNQLLTPHHDVFAKFSIITTGVTLFTSLAPAGAPVIGGGAGVEFRGSGTSWQMRVQVDIRDVNKGFPVEALYPIFKIRPLGGNAPSEVQVQPVEGAIHCYEGDSPRSNRGYFDGWIPVPHVEPGFQLITEVVENDFFFRFGGPRFDLALSAPGPQFFAGADRSTVHIGDDPVTAAQPIPHAVGAFGTSSPDPGTGVPNVLTETNGEMSDDIEAPITGLLSRQVRGALSDGLSGDLLQAYAITIQGYLSAPPTAEVDLRYVDPRSSFPGITGEPANTRALEATVHAQGSMDVFMQFLGIPCFDVTGEVTIDLTADIWASSTGPDTGIDVRSRYDQSNDTNFDMPWYNWLLASCRFAFLLLKGGAAVEIPGKVSDAVDGALGEDGSITKLLRGFDLNGYLPTIDIDPVTIGNTTTGGAVMRPVVTNLDNAWCRVTGSPAGCSVDDALLSTNGVGVTGDATLVASLGQSFGGALGGRFPNVFAPSRSGSVDDLVSTHRDAAGQLAGLGVVIDPRLINLALRHLVQGRPTGTTTDGLIDIDDYQTPVDAWSVSTRPEVAPMVLGVPPDFTPVPTRPTVRLVVPDVRLGLDTDPELEKVIQYSVAATANVAAVFDSTTGELSPELDSPVIDLMVTGGCQVDYTDAYALSYLLCGRGSGGNGGSDITSVTDVLDLFANEVVLKVLNDSVGGIGLPSLDGIVPNLHVALSNVRFAQRGGYLAAYADLRPAPLVRLVGSEAGYGGDDDTIRFFAVPTNFAFNDPTVTTSYQWEITDAVSEQPVAFTLYPGAGGSAVQFPSGAFQPADNLSRTKTATGKVTVTQRNADGDAVLTVSGTGSHSWQAPTPQPPPNCPPPPGSFLQALPGDVGGGSLGLVIC